MNTAAKPSSESESDGDQRLQSVLNTPGGRLLIDIRVGDYGPAQVIPILNGFKPRLQLVEPEDAGRPVCNPLEERNEAEPI